MFPSPDASSRPPVVSVSELNRSARKLLEQAFPLIWVAGEISNFVQAASGHWYFSLKDSGAQVRCVMFRNKSQYLDWKPADGTQVEVRVLVTLYEPRGDFQLNVEAMRRAGLGALYEAFERLKQRLDKEGLFDSACKRPLPAFPRQIGIVTSPAAAALRDVLTTLSRRMPSIPVVIYPTPVQGEGAAATIAAALRRAGERGECDVLILCRGGGSMEDLWQFNEEVVARAIRACPIPVVCGVGHETDVTIADFAADQRAPTPTAAAELASPNRADLMARVGVAGNRLTRSLRHGLEQRMQRVDYLGRRLTHPGERLDNQQRHVRNLQQRLQGALLRHMDNQRWRQQQLAQRLASARPDLEQMLSHQRDLAQRLELSLQRRMADAAATLQRLQANLAHLNPQSVLERGYSIVQTKQGNVVRDSAALAPGEKLDIAFARGRVEAQVTERGPTAS
jgi:exodeoxyribonuclease VII large subunit